MDRFSHTPTITTVDGQRVFSPSANDPNGRYYISAVRQPVASQRFITVTHGGPRAAARPFVANAGASAVPGNRSFTPQAGGRFERRFTNIAMPLEVARAPSRFPRTTDKSRGLRHFSSRVCEKVKEKGQTNYNEVADELVTEYFDSLSYPPQSTEKQQYDSKNIRRRVYDALNVLMAMNIIEKEKKEIRWVGLPTSSVQERRRLEEEKVQRQERIRQKSEQLQEYIIQLVAYKSLVNRNREQERTSGRPAEHSILYLPFIIVNTDRKTYIDCAISSDKTKYAMTFNNPFDIHDDIEVLKRLGLAHGLDTGAVSAESLDQVKEYLPPALRAYVDEIIENKQADDSMGNATAIDVTSTADGALELSTSGNMDASDDSPHAVATTPARSQQSNPGSATGTPQFNQTVVSSTGVPISGRHFSQRTTQTVYSVPRQISSARYVQPTQSAVYRNAQRANTQRLYVIERHQQRTAAPQPQRYFYTQRSAAGQPEYPSVSYVQGGQPVEQYYEDEVEYVEADPNEIYADEH